MVKATYDGYKQVFILESSSDEIEDLQIYALKDNGNEEFKARYDAYNGRFRILDGIPKGYVDGKVYDLEARVTKRWG